MEIILVSKINRGRRRVHFGRWGSRVLTTFALAALLGSGYLGYRLADVHPDPRPDLYAAAWAKEVHTQREEVQQAIRSATGGVDALAIRLGKLQARLVRLDALGGRLVDIASLDASELDFSAAPALGGPSSLGTSVAYTVPDFVAELERLARQLDDRAPKLSAIESALMTAKLHAEVSPSGRPVHKGRLSSHFGWRTDPVTGKRSFHEGLDFAGRREAEILAVASGVVVWAGHRGGYGKVVEIYHGNGYATRYAHNHKNRVKVGHTVKKGQTIAELGSSGHATGPHVHFEVLHDNKPVNPLEFVEAGSK